MLYITHGIQECCQTIKMTYGINFELALFLLSDVIWPAEVGGCFFPVLLICHCVDISEYLTVPEDCEVNDGQVGHSPAKANGIMEFKAILEKGPTSYRWRMQALTASMVAIIGDTTQNSRHMYMRTRSSTQFLVDNVALWRRAKECSFSTITWHFLIVKP